MAGKKEVYYCNTYWYFLEANQNKPEKGLIKSTLKEAECQWVNKEER